MVDEDTPCNLCGDPLGMDSGHRIRFGRYEGEPCHWACIAGAWEGRAMAAEVETARYKAAIEAHRSKQMLPSHSRDLGLWQALDSDKAWA